MKPKTAIDIFLSTVREINPELRVYGEMSPGSDIPGRIVLDSIHSGTIEIITEWRDDKLWVSVYSGGEGIKRSLLKRKTNNLRSILLWAVKETAAIRFARGLRNAQLEKDMGYSL